MIRRFRRFPSADNGLPPPVAVIAVGPTPAGAAVVVGVPVVTVVGSVIVAVTSPRISVVTVVVTVSGRSGLGISSFGSFLKLSHLALGDGPLLPSVIPVSGVVVTGGSVANIDQKILIRSTFLYCRKNLLVRRLETPAVVVAVSVTGITVISVPTVRTASTLAHVLLLGNSRVHLLVLLLGNLPLLAAIGRPVRVPVVVTRIRPTISILRSTFFQQIIRITRSVRNSSYSSQDLRNRNRSPANRSNHSNGYPQLRTPPPPRQPKTKMSRSYNVTPHKVVGRSYQGKKKLHVNLLLSYGLFWSSLS